MNCAAHSAAMVGPQMPLPEVSLGDVSRLQQRHGRDEFFLGPRSWRYVVALHIVKIREVNYAQFRRMYFIKVVAPLQNSGFGNVYKLTLSCPCSLEYRTLR